MKIKIEGMTCENCKRTVERLFSEIAGVDEVKVDLQNGFAEVKTSSEVPEQVFKSALEDTAYEVVDVER